MTSEAPQVEIAAPADVYTAASNLGGTGLKASRGFSAGTLIRLVDRPLIIALDTPCLKDTCYHCYEIRAHVETSELSGSSQDQTKLKICKGCRTVRYCCQEHQKASWKDCHKFECGIFAGLQPRVLPNNVRAVLRVLLLLQRGNIGSTEWTDLLRLQSSLKEIQTSRGQEFENLCLMAKAVQHYSGTSIPGSELVGILARLMTNSFALVTTTFDPIGVVLDPILARMNHSCDPNAYVRCDLKGTVQVIALKDISPDSEILVSYVDNTYPTRIRQKELKERYFFDCHCPKCIDPYDSDFALDKQSEIQVQQLLTTEAEVTEILKTATGGTDALASIQKLEYALSLLHTHHASWPLHQQPFAHVRHAYIVALIAAAQNNAAFVQAMIQKLMIDEIIMPNEFHPIRMVHDWVLLRLVDYILQGGGDGTARTVNLQAYDIHPVDLGVIRTALLDDLWGKVKRLPRNSFRSMVENTYEQLTEEEKLIRDSRIGTAGDQWAKVRKMIDLELKREKTQPSRSIAAIKNQ